MGRLLVSTHFAGLGNGLSGRYCVRSSPVQRARNSLQGDELTAPVRNGLAHHHVDYRDRLFVRFNDLPYQDRSIGVGLCIRIV